MEELPNAINEFGNEWLLNEQTVMKRRYQMQRLSSELDLFMAVEPKIKHAKQLYDPIVKASVSRNI